MRPGWAGPLAILMALTGAAAERRLSSESEAAVYGQYVFRGARRGPVGLIRQSSFAYRCSPRWTVGTSTWGYLQLHNGSGVGEARYGGWLRWQPSRLLTVGGGGLYYDRNDKVGNRLFQGPPTAEVYGWVGLDLPLAPRLSAYYDLDANVGSYLMVDVRHRFKQSANGWSLTLSGSLGYDLGRTQGFNDAHLRGELWYALGDGLDIGPALDWWLPAKAVDALSGAGRFVASAGMRYHRAF